MYVKFCVKYSTYSDSMHCKCMYLVVCVLGDHHQVFTHSYNIWQLDITIWLVYQISNK